MRLKMYQWKMLKERVTSSSKPNLAREIHMRQILTGDAVLEQLALTTEW